MSRRRLVLVFKLCVVYVLMKDCRRSQQGKRWDINEDEKKIIGTLFSSTYVLFWRSCITNVHYILYVNEPLHKYLVFLYIYNRWIILQYFFVHNARFITIFHRPTLLNYIVFCTGVFMKFLYKVEGASSKSCHKQYYPLVQFAWLVINVTDMLFSYVIMSINNIDFRHIKFWYYERATKHETCV